MIQAGLVIARFAHFAAVMVLFGLALFPFYGYPIRAGAPARMGQWLRASMWGTAVLGLVSALAWGWFTIASMTGTISAVADPDGLQIVLRETSFGQVWVARLALLGVLLVLMTRSGLGRHRDWLITVVAAVLLLSVALVGHTQSNGGAVRAVHVLADGGHLLAGGAWLGGLFALGYLLRPARRFPSEHTADATAALVRFSGIGYAVVATILGSGLINAWLLMGSPSGLVTTPYGQLLALKLCLLAGMLGFAAANRFRLVPRLQASRERGLPADASLRMLRRSVMAEQMLGLGVVLIAAGLGTLQPAIAAAH